MDDLDRLYFEFVEILRRERPAALTGSLTVLEIYDQVAPYRRVRNACGFRSNDDYEVALSRLLSGERGYLLSDRDVQEEVKAGLEEVLPDIRRYLAFPDAKVWLNRENIPPPGHIRYAPPELRGRTDWASLASEDSGEAPGSAAAGVEPDEAALAEAASEAETSSDAAAQPGSALQFCPRCGAELPGEASFCPFCGSRVAPDTCRACGATLEPTWLYCAGCGTSREDQSTGAS